MSYKPDEKRDAKAFDILQNLPLEIAQAFFWNFRSRSERRDAILAFHAYDEMRREPAPPPTTGRG